MKAVLSALVALAAVGVSWVFGGPLGGVLNAPGLLLLGAARAMGILPRFEERGMGRWITLATILSAFFWWLLTYLALRIRPQSAR